MIRIFFCFGPAFLVMFPLGMIGFPILPCLVVGASIFGFGWQVTDNVREQKRNKNEIESSR